MGSFCSNGDLLDALPLFMRYIYTKCAFFSDPALFTEAYDMCTDA